MIDPTDPKHNHRYVITDPGFCGCGRRRAQRGERSGVHKNYTYSHRVRLMLLTCSFDRAGFVVVARLPCGGEEWVTEIE